MLGHIRSGTLDKFKEAFDKALESGEGFSVAARDCAQSYMALFDEGCAGKFSSKCHSVGQSYSGKKLKYIQ